MPRGLRWRDHGQKKPHRICHLKMREGVCLWNVKTSIKIVINHNCLNVVSLTSAATTWGNSNLYVCAEQPCRIRIWSRVPKNLAPEGCESWYKNGKASRWPRPCCTAECIVSVSELWSPATHRQFYCPLVWSHQVLIHDSTTTRTKSMIK